MHIVLRGGGDLASGVALRLHRAGLQVAICELGAPLAVRRLVSFSEAIYQGRWQVEEVTARRVSAPDRLAEIQAVFARGEIPVVIDPQGRLPRTPGVRVVVDARMLKMAQPVPAPQANWDLLIGLGPGFEAGKNCDALVETMRGHTLGRVFWSGTAQPDTGQPDPVQDQSSARVLRAPATAHMSAGLALGSVIRAGAVICRVGDHPVVAPFEGALRGLLPDGCAVTQGLKIGDLDPRADPALCRLVSDKALAIGGGVLEAILARPMLRRALFSA